MKSTTKFFICIIALMICVNSHAGGLPGSFLIDNKWRVIGSEFSPLTNPAFISERSSPHAQYVGSSIMGEFTMNNVSVSAPMTINQSAGISWLNQGTKPYSQIQFDPSTLNETNLGTIRDANDVGTFTYAVSPWAPLSLGLNVNLISHRFASNAKMTFGTDLGAALQIPEHEIFGKHTIGLSIQNAIAPVIGTPFSRTLMASWYGRYLQKQIITAADFQLSDIGTPSSEGSSVRWKSNVKVGFWPLQIIKAYGLMGLSPDGVDYYGFAGGCNFPFMNKGRDLELLYQYVNLTGSMATNSIYIQSEFGWNRDDAHQKHLEDLRNRAPGELYKRGLSLFNDKKYWEAFFTFTQIKSDYPKYRRMDEVEFYAGASLERLDMRKAAIEKYETALSTYKNSDLIGDITLALVRLYYRDKNFTKVDELFGAMYELVVPDSLKFESYYFRAEAYIKTGEYSSARQLFFQIPEGHPIYPYAMFSAAVVDQNEGNYAGMKVNLMKVISYQPMTPAEQEIVNRAYLLLGYLYLEDLMNEEKSLNNSVSSLRAIPKESRYYPEALVGLGWAALRGRNWKDCTENGLILLNMKDVHPILRAEGALVAGFAAYTQKDYPAAIDILKQGTALADEAGKVAGPVQALSVKELRSKYDEISAKAIASSHKKNTEGMNSIVELHRQQQLIKVDIDNALSAEDNVQKDLEYKERLSSLKIDVGYILADATKRISGKKTEQIKEKLKVKEKEYDQKIKELQNEIKQLQ